MSLLFALSLVVFVLAIAEGETQFTYIGFQGPINKVDVGGLASILSNGILEFSDYWPSYAYYPHPVAFKPNHLSFSTTFVFAMPNQSSNGAAFIISPSKNFQLTLPDAYPSTNCLRFKSNQVFAVVLGAVQNTDQEDVTDGNHVGIYVNCAESVDTTTAAYYSDTERMNKTLLLNSGESMQIWIDYDEVGMLVNVTLAPYRNPKPIKSLLSKQLNLSSIFKHSMYVGFFSGNGFAANHYIQGWSWNQDGKAQNLDHSKLPKIPQTKHQKHNISLIIFVVLLVVVLLLVVVIVVAAWLVRRKKYKELLEPWEKEYAPNRFSFKDLSLATKDFQNIEILGVGGFGKVYKGILPSTGEQVAVKRVSHDSKQGMKEFVAEISSMRKLSHKNLVKLLGYCRRKGELLLVYEYMPKGSLDKFLFIKDDKSNLCWSSRFKIIKGVASALLYLHEGCEQVVLHRDVKASNVLLDAEMNARLGDFGLARFYDHNNDPQTTHVVGTIGYIAPEVCRTRKPTTSTDVFAFGMFLLEVGCGRKPTGKQDADDDAKALFLSDWVYDCWKNGEILKASDPKMEGDYQENEMELVLKLGLLCLHPKAESRPSIRQVVQFLDGSASLPDILSEYDPEACDFFGEDLETMYPLPSSSAAVLSSTISALYYGR